MYVGIISAYIFCFVGGYRRWWGGYFAKHLCLLNKVRILRITHGREKSKGHFLGLPQTDAFSVKQAVREIRGKPTKPVDNYVDSVDKGHKNS